MQDLEAVARAWDKVASTFDADAQKSVARYLELAKSADNAAEVRAMLLLAALSLGGNVWQPKTPAEHFRFDVFALVDRMAESLGIVPSGEPTKKRRARKAKQDASEE